MPDEAAGEAISSGKYGLPAGQTVPIKTDEGIKQVPVDLVPGLLRKGASVATHQDIAEEQYGGLATGTEAVAEGALSGATLGLSDLALGDIPGVRQHVAGVKEAHPYVRGAGELLGTLAPAIFSGGATESVSGAEMAARAVPEIADAVEGAGAVGQLLRGAGRVLAAPTEAASEVGSLFEHGVGSLVGKEATTLAGRMAQSGAKMAGRGLAEGSIYGAGQELSEQSLGDSGLNGEKLLAAAGHGALLGALAGAPLGAAGALGGEVIGRLAAKGLGEERAAKAIISGSGQLKSVKEMQRIPGGVKAVGRELLDRKLVRAGDSIEEIAPRIEAERAKIGDALGKLGEQADALGAEGPKILPLTNKLMQANGSLMETISAFPSLTSGAKSRVEGLLQDLSLSADETGTLTFVRARDLRSKLDQMIKWESPAPGMKSPVQDAMRDVRSALEGEIERSMDVASKQLGGDALKEYRVLKQSYRKIAVADDAAQRAVSSRSANRVISPTDYGAGIIGSAASGIMGLVPGAGIVTGLAASLAHHYVRERGASTAAVYLDRIAQLQAVRRAAAKVDTRIAGEVEKLSKPEKVSTALAVRGSPGTYMEKRNLVTDAVAAMPEHKAAVWASSAPLSAHAPETSAAFASAAIRATSYLASMLPPHPRKMSLLPQPRKDSEPAPEDKARFVRVFNAVNDPVSILSRANSGSITRDEVDGVAATHPKLLTQIRSQVTAAIGDMEPGATMPQSRKEAYSILLGQPVDETVSGRFAESMQSAYAAPPPPKGPKPEKKTGAGAPKREIKTAGLSGLSKPYGSKSS